MLTSQKKKEIVDSYKIHEKDTGSTEVQIALLTERIKQIAGHLDSSKKDYSSKRGFMKLIGRRRRLLNYFKKTKPNEYKKFMETLKI